MLFAPKFRRSILKKLTAYRLRLDVPDVLDTLYIMLLNSRMPCPFR